MINSVEDALLILEATRMEYLKRARALAIKHAVDNFGSASVDDLHEICPVPKEIDGRVMGAVFTDRAVWSPAGYIKSRRPICHGRTITVFNLISYDQTNA